MPNGHIFHRNFVPVEDKSKGIVNWAAMAVVRLQRKVQSGQLVGRAVNRDAKETRKANFAQGSQNNLFEISKSICHRTLTI